MLISRGCYPGSCSNYSSSCCFLPRSIHPFYVLVDPILIVYFVLIPVALARSLLNDLQCSQGGMGPNMPFPPQGPMGFSQPRPPLMGFGGRPLMMGTVPHDVMLDPDEEVHYQHPPFVQD